MTLKVLATESTLQPALAVNFKSNGSNQYQWNTCYYGLAVTVDKDAEALHIMVPLWNTHISLNELQGRCSLDHVQNRPCFIFNVLYSM